MNNNWPGDSGRMLNLYIRHDGKLIRYYGEIKVAIEILKRLGEGEVIII